MNSPGCIPCCIRLVQSLLSLVVQSLLFPCGTPLVVQSLLFSLCTPLCIHWVHPVSLYQSGYSPGCISLGTPLVNSLFYPIHNIPGVPVWGVFWGGFLLDTPLYKYSVLPSPGVLIGLSIMYTVPGCIFRVYPLGIFVPCYNLMLLRVLHT